MIVIPKVANASGIDSPCWDHMYGCTPAIRLRESLWEHSPWQHKYFLVLACHSPTQHLQKDGISLPSDSISPSVLLFSVSLVHTIVSPAFFSTELDQQLALMLSLTKAGQSHRAFAHSMLWILLLYCSASYFVLIFCFFSKFLLKLSVDFQCKEHSRYQHAEWNEKFHWQLKDVAQALCRSVSPLVAMTGIIIYFVVTSPADLIVLCKAGLYGSLYCTE